MTNYNDYLTVYCTECGERYFVQPDNDGYIGLWCCECDNYISVSVPQEELGE